MPHARVGALLQASVFKMEEVSFGGRLATSNGPSFKQEYSQLRT